MRERVYYLENGLTEVDKCKNCGKEVPFQRNFYSKFCSRSCVNKYTPKQTTDINVEELRQYLLKNKTTKGWLRTKKVKSKIESIFRFTANFDKHDSNLNERVYSIINNIQDRPKCKMCNNTCNYKHTGIYTSYCSQQCENKDEEKNRKREITCLKRYGVKHYTSTKKHKEDKTKTCLLKYGVKCGLSNTLIRDKIKNTNKERYGEENFTETDVFKERCIKTCTEKYGTSHYSQTKEFKEKQTATCLKRYGVSHIMHNEDVFSKSMKNKFKKKKYEFNSGRVEYVQGYEPKVIKELENHFSDEDIIINQKLMPDFWYVFEGKKRRYYPDIYIKSKNLIIEVKSKYTYEVDFDRNQLKRDSCLMAGFNFLFVIF